MIPTCLRQSSGGVILRVRVQPNAKRTEIVGMHGEELKIRLHAPPVDGKANEMLIHFLADVLAMPKSGIELIHGGTARSKQVLIRGKSAEEVNHQLAPEKSS